MGLEKKIKNVFLAASLATLTGCAYHYIKPTISGESVSFKMKDENKVNYTFPLFCSITKPEGGEPVAGIYTKNPDESYENVLKRCMEDKGFVPGFIANYTSNFPKDAKFYPTDKEIRMEKGGEATIPITGHICEIKEWSGRGLESKASTLCIPKSYASSATNVVTFPSPATSAQPAQPQTPNNGTVVILPFPRGKSQPETPKQQQQTQIPQSQYQYPQGPTMIINNLYCTPRCPEVPPQPRERQKKSQEPEEKPRSQKKSQYTPSYNIPSTPSNVPAEPEEERKDCEPCECEPCEEDYQNKIEMW
jgi:hypothetical protein